jgi:hypothetical protein
MNRLARTPWLKAPALSRLALAAAPLLALAIFACGGDSDGEAGDSTAATAGGVDVRGEITLVATPIPDVSLGYVRVEGEVEADTRYANAWVRMKETTVVLRQQGAETITASATDLAPGQRVEVTFDGVVAELDPVQASAAEIVILD